MSEAAQEPTPPRAIAAMLLFSRDTERLAAFYREQLGLPLQRVVLAGVDPHWACELQHVYLSIWPTNAPLVQGAAAHRGGVALYVSDVQREHARLAAAGVPVDFAPRQSPLGIISRLRDPDGNPFELYQPLPPRP